MIAIVDILKYTIINTPGYLRDLGEGHVSFQDFDGRMFARCQGATN